MWCPPAKHLPPQRAEGKSIGLLRDKKIQTTRQPLKQKKGDKYLLFHRAADSDNKARGYNAHFFYNTGPSTPAHRRNDKNGTISYHLHYPPIDPSMLDYPMTGVIGLEPFTSTARHVRPLGKS